LWKATLKTLDFMPLMNADYRGGVIIYDWYSDNESYKDQIKVTVRFLNNEIKSNSIEVITHKKICETSEKCKTTLTLPFAQIVLKLSHMDTQNNKLMLDILEKYYNDGLLYKQTHPKYDLTIWNYSPKVQYERLWDDITLQCRGLVTNSKGDIVARPFKKFFNYEEHKPEEIPNEYFEVYEKMDGSLGILFNYNGEWILATRGSFTSPQAIKGRELLEKYDYNRLVKDYTYLFEIIYPENRIVCNYDFEDLILLGMIHTDTGDEVNIHNNDNQDIRLKNLIRNINLKIVTLYKTWGEGYDLLKEEISNDKEGYVIRFKNGFRMKIKGDEYVRLHRILTNISNRDIWEYLKDNKPFDELLEKVPDEFNNWVKETARDLTVRFENIDNDYNDIFNSIFSLIETKKEFAEKAKQYPYSSLLFAMYDGKQTHQIILKLL
jgi:RNA ligase